MSARREEVGGGGSMGAGGKTGEDRGSRVLGLVAVGGAEGVVVGGMTTMTTLLASHVEGIIGVFGLPPRASSNKASPISCRVLLQYGARVASG